MFWTDSTQAQERLAGTVVCYDKKPHYIERVDAGTASCLQLGKDKYKNIPLDDEKWNNFRDLPKLGWFNFVAGSKVHPYFIERRAVNSRSHGLNTANTVAYSLQVDGLQKERYNNLTDYLKNEGYQETMNDDAAYPKLSEVLMALDSTPAGVAFSPKFCAVVTSEGMKWLYRNNKRIGFFTGTDSLNLFPLKGFFKEELQACPTFDINNIREF